MQNEVLHPIQEGFAPDSQKTYQYDKQPTECQLVQGLRMVYKHA